MNHIMACVTLQNTCERLIREAAAQKQKPNDLLFVLHVAKNGQSIMGGTNDAASLEYLYSVSQKAGADMTVLHSDDVISAICSFIAEQAINIAVLGVPGPGDKDNGLLAKLSAALPETCRLILIDKQKGVLPQ